MAGGARRIVVEFLGDSKNLSGELSKVESRTHKFGSTMAGVGKAALFGFTGGAVLAGGALAGMTKNAVEDQAAHRRLAIALKNSTGATQEQIGSVENWISKQGVALGVTDDEIRPALQRLVQSTGSVSKAQKEMSIAMDVSAGTGKSLDVVSAALMKANNGTTASLSKLGLKTKDAEGNTLSLKDALSSMSETFKGQAAQQADSLQGKMGRLKLVFDEAKESIGYKLIPVVSSLATWLLQNLVPAVNATVTWIGQHLGPIVKQVGEYIQTKVIPAIQLFVQQMKDGTGPGGKLVTVLSNLWGAAKQVWGILRPLGEWMLNNKTVVATFATVIGTVVLAVKAWRAAQAALDVVLSANPIGLVVVAIAALIAGLVYAYKKSETFRDIVKAVGGVLGDVAGVMTHFGDVINNKVGAAIDDIRGIPGKVKNAIGNLGHLLWDAGSQIIQGLIDGITSKINALTDKLHSITSLIPIHKGPPSKDRILLKPAGIALMDGLIDGIEQGKVKLQTVLDKLTAYIKDHQQKLADALSAKRDMVSAFKGFQSSIFSTDVSQQEGQPPASIQTILAAGAAGRQQAEQLSADVKALIDKGLSRDLLTQLQNSGQAGEEQIHLLAQGTVDQIAQANADNAATMKALQDAGLAAAKAQGIDDQIKQQERDIKLADTIRDKLKELLDLQDKNTIVQLSIDGKILQVSLLKLKRANGGAPLGLT